MKRILFLTSLFVAIAVVVFIFAALSPSSPVDESRKTQESPSPFQKPSSLSILSVSPPQNLDEEKLPIQQVTFLFNQAVNPRDIFYSVSPAQEISIRQGSLENEIIISSKEAWEEGINTIRILIETISLSGAHLDEDFEYSLRVGFPNTLPPDFEE